MIRKATKKDASRLAEILIFAKRTAYRSIFQDDLVSFNEMQVLDLALYYRDSPEALDDVFVYDDGIVRGMMSWDRRQSNSGLWQLSELYIDPFFQHQGIGAALMLNFLSNAKCSGMNAGFLWVLEQNKSARNFYHKFGFRPNGERELQPGTDQYLLKYVKDL